MPQGIGLFEIYKSLSLSLPGWPTKAVLTMRTQSDHNTMSSIETYTYMLVHFKGIAHTHDTHTHTYSCYKFGHMYMYIHVSTLVEQVMFIIYYNHDYAVYCNINIIIVYIQKSIHDNIVENLLISMKVASLVQMVQ